MSYRTNSSHCSHRCNPETHSSSIKMDQGLHPSINPSHTPNKTASNRPINRPINKIQPIDHLINQLTNQINRINQNDQSNRSYLGSVHGRVLRGLVITVHSVLVRLFSSRQTDGGKTKRVFVRVSEWRTRDEGTRSHNQGATIGNDEWHRSSLSSSPCSRNGRRDTQTQRFNRKQNQKPTASKNARSAS